jgi:hypothetical protein
VTAAHCFVGVDLSALENYFAVVGGVFRTDTNPVRFNMRAVYMHPQYSEETQENDIAVVELNRAVDFNNPRFGFICLPTRDLNYPPEGMSSTALGWGRLVEDGASSYTLQQVQIPVVAPSNPLCIDQINDAKIQFCAGLVEGGKDTCQGDR